MLRVREMRAMAVRGDDGDAAAATQRRAAHDRRRRTDAALARRGRGRPRRLEPHVGLDLDLVCFHFRFGATRLARGVARRRSVGVVGKRRVSANVLRDRNIDASTSVRRQCRARFESPSSTHSIQTTTQSKCAHLDC